MESHGDQNYSRAQSGSARNPNPKRLEDIIERLYSGVTRVSDHHTMAVATFIR